MSLILPILLLSPGLALAQAGLPATPEPELCQIEPLDLEELSELASEPFELAADRIPSPADVPDESLNAVVGVVTESIACTNANLPLRSLALYTDRYLAERFSSAGGDELGHLSAAATRSPKPANAADRLTLISVANVMLLEDGRISVQVVTANAEFIFSDILVFAETDTGWRIDQVIRGDELVPLGTPVTTSEDSRFALG